MQIRMFILTCSYHVLNFGLMNHMTASVFEHITNKGDHIISFSELGNLFFSNFHVVTITQVKVKVKGKSVFILFFYSLS